MLLEELLISEVNHLFIIVVQMIFGMSVGEHQKLRVAVEADVGEKFTGD